MEIKIAAGYVRVSTDDQLEYSPDSQIKLIRDHAKREGYIIPEEFIYKDDGISGKSAAKRPAFQLMIATAKESPSPFDSIFVWKYSRFARNQEESLVYKNLLKKNGVAVKSISEPSSDSPFSGLIESIISWMDEYYLINLSGEVKRGMAEKAQRGEAMGKAPFGYRVENKILVPDDNAPIVRYIYECYSAGETYREIGVKLAAQGVKQQNGQPINLESVRYILKNPAYIGKTRWDLEGHAQYRSPRYRPDVDAMPDGKHEPIISRELWDAAQKRLASRPVDVRYKQGKSPVGMLKGIARCSSCGATLIDVTRNGVDKKRRLQCCKYGRGLCRVSHFIYMEKLEEMVIAGIEDAVNAESFTFSPPEMTHKPRLSQDWDKLIAAEESRLKRAKEGYLNGLLDADEYAEAKAAAKDNIEKFRAQQKKENAADQDKPDVAACKARAMGALEILKSPDVDGETKNKALRSIVDKIVYNKPQNTVDIFFGR